MFIGKRNMNSKIIIIVCCVIMVTCNPVPDKHVENLPISLQGSEYAYKKSAIPKDDLMGQETFYHWGHRPIWGGWSGYYRPYYYGWHGPYWGGYWRRYYWF